MDSIVNAVIQVFQAWAVFMTVFFINAIFAYDIHLFIT